MRSLPHVNDRVGAARTLRTHLTNAGIGVHLYVYGDSSLRGTRHSILRITWDTPDNSRCIFWARHSVVIHSAGSVGTLAIWVRPGTYESCWTLTSAVVSRHSLTSPLITLLGILLIVMRVLQPTCRVLCASTVT